MRNKRKFLPLLAGAMIFWLIMPDSVQAESRRAQKVVNIKISLLNDTNHSPARCKAKIYNFEDNEGQWHYRERSRVLHGKNARGSIAFNGYENGNTSLEFQCEAKLSRNLGKTIHTFKTKMLIFRGTDLNRHHELRLSTLQFKWVK